MNRREGGCDDVFTGVSNLDTSIDETNAWLAEIAGEFGTEDRRLAAGSCVFI